MITKNISLVSYGPVSKDFKTIAGLKKQMLKVKAGEVEQHRVDCYPFRVNSELINKFNEELRISLPESFEIFYPSEKYPPHVDEGGTSYFIPLESGNFFIDGVSYPIVPFVLYGFDDGKLHNTDFCAVMLK